MRIFLIFKDFKVNLRKMKNNFKKLKFNFLVLPDVNSPSFLRLAS
jgi:hypothetical protein